VLVQVNTEKKEKDSLRKREVSHDPREIEPRQWNSLRLHRKYPGSHSRKLSILSQA
jgi:hypothetical protein